MKKTYCYRNLSDQRGVIGILGVVIYSSVILVIGTTMVTTSVISLKNANDRIASTQSYYNAESGAEDALLQIQRDSSYGVTPVALTTMLDSINRFETTVETQSVSSCSAAKVITSSGFTRALVRRVQLNNCPQPSTRIAFNYGLQAGDGGITMANNAVVNGSTYSNGSHTGGNGARVVGDAWVANDPAPDPNPLYDPGSPTDFTFGNSSNSSRIDTAQSFIANTSNGATLGRVSIKVRKYGSPSTAAVRIVTDNNGKPGSTQIASGTLPASSVTTTSGFVDVSLSSATNLVNGNKYWIVIDASSSSSNYWAWAAQSGYNDGAGVYSPAWLSSGSMTWTAAGMSFAFKVFVTGPVTQLNFINVGANAHAHTIANSQVTGSAYYQTISNTTVGGSSFPNSADPAPKDLPISDANVDEFHNEAMAGPTYTGNYTLTGDGNIGPMVITGDLIVNGGVTLKLKGTVWVKGNINFNNNTALLDPGYVDNSGTIVTDGVINLSNGFSASGSGPNSYILLLSTSNNQAGAINVSNNASGIIFAATKGTLNLSNNSSANALSAYKLVLANNAVVNYNSGLADVPFSAGPGGGYAAKGWQEILE